MLRCYHQLNLTYFQNDEGSKTMFSELLSEKQHIKNNTHKNLCKWIPSSDPPSSFSGIFRFHP